jgi:hypothetical protein
MGTLPPPFDKLRYLSNSMYKSSAEFGIFGEQQNKKPIGPVYLVRGLLDPDPLHRSFLIRIRIRNLDPDPGVYFNFNFKKHTILPIKATRELIEGSFCSRLTSIVSCMLSLRSVLQLRECRALLPSIAA